MTTDKMKAALAKAARGGDKPVDAAVETSKQTPSEPTPEQHRKGVFERGGSKIERGQVSALAYRRQPRFETLAKDKDGGISDDALRAMRFYRERFEASNRSLTRCALDVTGRGGGGGTPSAPPTIMADHAVRTIEAAIGAYITTVRAIVLDDQTFSEVAIERFGGKANVDKPMPRSGRHRQIVRDEFMAGLTRLTSAAAPFLISGLSRRGTALVAAAGGDFEPSGSTGEIPSEPVAAPPYVDPRLLDEHGRLRPDNEIAHILRGGEIGEAA